MSHCSLFIKEVPEAAVNEDAVDTAREEPCEQNETKPQERFQELKTKLEDNLSKRAKLNNKIEEIMKKKFTEAKELAEKRLQVVLASILKK